MSSRPDNTDTTGSENKKSFSFTSVARSTVGAVTNTAKSGWKLYADSQPKHYTQAEIDAMVLAEARQASDEGKRPLLSEDGTPTD
jgi:hypothetical protein